MSEYSESQERKRLQQVGIIGRVYKADKHRVILKRNPEDSQYFLEGQSVYAFLPNFIENEYQCKLMKFDPVTGEEKPYPSNAKDYRSYHGKLAWLFNPWTGTKRDAGDIGTDIDGRLIDPA